VKLAAPDFTKTKLWRRADKNHSLYLFCYYEKSGLNYSKSALITFNTIVSLCVLRLGKDMVREEKPRTVYWLGDNLYLNITNKCSNRCIFCFRNFKRGVGDFTLWLSEEPSFEQVTKELEEAMRKRAWKEIVFCGFGEPTERLDLLLEVTRWIKRRYGKLVIIRVNTNGHGYALNANRDVAGELKAAGVDKVSVSLNAHGEEAYNEVCKPVFAGAFAAVLEFIEKAEGKLDVEVTAVTASEVDLHKVEDLAKSMSVKFRLRVCIPCFW
jgi:cyclic pyranopterin phosphate synthase